MKNMDYKTTLFSESLIQSKITNLAKHISKDYLNSKLVLICVLKGSFMFFSDLVRQINLKELPEIDFIQVSSYGSETESSGQIKMLKDINIDVTGKDILIIEDIVDTGLTVKYLTDYFFKTKKFKSVKVCTLLQKPSKMKVEVFVDYVGFMIEDHFVFGYGLDVNEKYRNVPEIFYFKEKKV